MGKPCRSTRMSAARPGEASTSRAPSSTKQAEHLPCDHFQPQTQKLSNDRMLTKTQSQPSNTRVLRSNNLANLPSKMSPVACDSTSTTKTTRSPVLAKRVYRRNIGRDAVDMRQRRHDERLGNVDLKLASYLTFQGRKRENHASGSKPQTKHSTKSVNVKHTARSAADQVSKSADKAAGLADYDPVFVKRVQASQEAIRMALAMGSQELLEGSVNWNLNWSCSLMTHDTDVTPRDWLYFM